MVGILSAVALGGLCMQAVVASPNFQHHHAHHHHVERSAPLEKRFTTTGFGGTTSPVDNGDPVTYVGNIGQPYGSNIITIDSSEADNYMYTNKFVSKYKAPVDIIIWNKAGPNSAPNSGQFSAPALTFTLHGGSEQYVAFDSNSQVAWCQNSKRSKTTWGAWDCTYGEANFGDASNQGWSAYDVSSIQNTEGNTTPMTIEEPNGETSSWKSNGYTSDSQANGIGGNLAPGPVRMTTTFGH